MDQGSAEGEHGGMVQERVVVSLELWHKLDCPVEAGLVLGGAGNSLTPNAIEFVAGQNCS